MSHAKDPVTDPSMLMSLVERRLPYGYVSDHAPLSGRHLAWTTPAGTWSITANAALNPRVMIVGPAGAWRLDDAAPERAELVLMLLELAGAIAPPVPGSDKRIQRRFANRSKGPLTIYAPGAYTHTLQPGDSVTFTLLAGETLAPMPDGCVEVDEDGQPVIRDAATHSLDGADGSNYDPYRPGVYGTATTPEPYATEPPPRRPDADPDPAPSYATPDPSYPPAPDPAPSYSAPDPAPSYSGGSSSGGGGYSGGYDSGGSSSPGGYDSGGGY